MRHSSIEEKLGRIWFCRTYDREDLYGPGGAYNHVIGWTKEFMSMQEQLGNIDVLYEMENIIKQNLLEALLSPSPWIRSVAEESLSNFSL